MSLPATTRQDTPNDVGTLWTMRRYDRRAVARSSPGSAWSFAVIDGDTLLAERRPRRGSLCLADQ